MLNELFLAISTQWAAISRACAEAGPLANALQISAAAIGGYKLIRKYIHRHFQTLDGRILDLEAAVERRERANVQLTQDLKMVQQELESNRNRLACTAIEKADLELGNGNHERADTVLRTWLAEEGPGLADLMNRRAARIVATASDESHSAGLIVAEAYATAALVINPQLQSAAGLAADVRRHFEQEPWQPTLHQALNQLESGDPAFDRGRLDDAMASLSRARQHDQDGTFYLAVPLFERAATLVEQELGPRDIATIRVKLEFAASLLRVDQRQRAHALIEDSVDVYEEHPEFGPRSEETQRVRLRLVNCWLVLGQDTKALAITERIIRDCRSIPELADAFLPLLEALRVTAGCCLALGRQKEASDYSRQALDLLPRIEGLEAPVAETIRSSLYRTMGNPEAALLHARRSVDLHLTDKQFGPNSPATLHASVHLADLLERTGHHSEALKILTPLIDQCANSPAFGLTHSTTLSLRASRARVLCRQGAFQDALSETQSLEKDTFNPENFADGGFATLKSRLTGAKALLGLGRHDEALASAKACSELASDEQGGMPLRELRISALCLQSQALLALSRHAEAREVVQEVDVSSRALPRTAFNEQLWQEVEQSLVAVR
jgi:tetratricopeptide (TPR) repeat protein